MKNNVTEELNTFLKGNFMAIHAYDKYIHRITDEGIKKVLQEIQQNHKHHAAMVAERIQNLGSKPVNDVGVMGKTAEVMSSIKGAINDPIDILKDSLVGEHRGIKKSKELLDGDLDAESLALVQQILNVDENHVKLLDGLIH